MLNKLIKFPFLKLVLFKDFTTFDLKLKISFLYDLRGENCILVRDAVQDIRYYLTF